jgi:sodium-coupled monocarboxylate transporter 8/12
MLYAVGIIVQVVLGLDETELIATIIIMGLFTTLYTVVGGFEAVIWTDVLQAITLGLGMILVLIIALNGIDGGLGTVWEIGQQHDKFAMFRLEFDLTAIPGSVFSALALGLFSFLAIFGTEQPVVQRYVSMPSITEAQRSILLNAIVTVAVGLLFFVVGSTIFAHYQMTSPAHATASGLPSLPKEDQIVPYFILNEIPFPGLMGILLAGLFAAAMSSVDSGINSLTALVICDWLPGRTLKLGLSQLCCAGFGIAVTGAALLVPYMGTNVYSIIIKIEGTLIGPLLGLFLLGIFSSRTNTSGALAGVLVGIAVSVYLSLTGELAYWWYAAFTCLPTVVVGSMTSFFFPRPTADKVDGLVAAWKYHPGVKTISKPKGS